MKNSAPWDDDEVRRPLPPRLDPRAGSRSDTSGKGRHRGLAVAARLLAAAIALVVLGSTGWGWYLERVAEASVTRTDAIPADGNNGPVGTAMNLLLVGDDSRADLSAAQRKLLHTGGDSGELNTDTMMLLHVPADGSKATFVSFPRDSYVEIPGHGWDKLNAAYADGYLSTPSSAPESQRQAAGQQLLVQTISKLSGLHIDHFASVDLLGFFNLSKVVGGVQVNLCYPVHDTYTGADFPAGVQTIQGPDALKFVRERHGVRPDGSAALPRGDLDRIVRQQVFLAGVARKMLSQKVLLDLGKQQELVQSVAKSLTVDQSLDLIQLAQQMQSITAGGVSFQTIPIVGDARDDKNRSILQLPDTATLHEWFAKLSADPEPDESAGKTQAAPKTVAPSAVTVQVFNGSGTTGLAGDTAKALETKGYVVAGTANADSSDYAKTEIRYATGDEALAATLAATIKGATVAENADATPGTVQLILGKDFTAVGQALTPVQAAPETSAADAARTAADTSCIN